MTPKTLAQEYGLQTAVAAAIIEDVRAETFAAAIEAAGKVVEEMRLSRAGHRLQAINANKKGEARDFESMAIALSQALSAIRILSPTPVAGEPNEGFGEYAIEPIEGVDPALIPHMMLGAMAARYARQAQIEMSDAFEAARATWHTEWDSHPRPRTMQDALDAVDSDLEYWDEE